MMIYDDIDLHLKIIYNEYARKSHKMDFEQSNFLNEAWTFIKKCIRSIFFFDPQCHFDLQNRIFIGFYVLQSNATPKIQFPCLQV